MKKSVYLVTGLLIILLTACSSPVATIAQSPSLTPANAGNAQPATSQSSTQSGQEVSFSKDIFPIFQQYSDSHHSGGNVLSLDTYEGVIQDVIAGQPEQSKLYQRLVGQGGPVMPPGNPLPQDLITLIYNWIKQGAKNN